MKKKVFLVMMPVMALVFGFVFTACPTDDDKGGGVEAGKLEGSGWVRIDTYSNQWDFTWTRTFTSDKAGTLNQKGWGMVGSKKQNYNTTSNFTYSYYPEIREGIIDNKTVFAISDDYKTLTEGSLSFTRQ